MIRGSVIPTGVEGSKKKEVKILRPITHLRFFHYALRAPVRMNYVSVQANLKENSGLKEDLFFSSAKAIFSILCATAISASFFAFPASINLLYKVLHEALHLEADTAAM